MLSLHRTGLEHPWFARPVLRPQEFQNSDESAASTTSTEEYSIYKSYFSTKKVSENRPRITQNYGDYLDLPSGKNFRRPQFLARNFELTVSADSEFSRHRIQQTQNSADSEFNTLRTQHSELSILCSRLNFFWNSKILFLQILAVGYGKTSKRGLGI